MLRKIEKKSFPEDQSIIRIFKYIEAIKYSKDPILITGETGEDKELIAGAIHFASSVRGNFMAINAAGLDDNLFSDTLFGHVNGSCAA